MPLFQADNVDVLMLNEAPLPFRFTVVRDELLLWAPVKQETLAVVQATLRPTLALSLSK